ncbi:hypothetical protein KSP40_PGU012501 [Platanthera guangdongensis]|uniref:Uncharacterized protein n=1 Tax=Platanthera guangdongensis TaxID=2320717 RepID=A0ABR2MWN0_9ASPA
MAESPFHHLFFLFLSFFSAAIATGSSPLVGSSHLPRLLDIHDRERAPPSVQVATARGVLARLLPSHLSSIEFDIISKEQCGGEVCFIISNHPSYGSKGAPEVRIHGVSGVELSAGLHWYLKNWCAAHISWDKTGGAQLSSVPKPGSLPKMNPNGILIRRLIPWSYYQNAVTSSYSFAWWDWERWEKEIDWMALQGVNLPLAFNGQEAIWQKVFQRRRPLRRRFPRVSFSGFSRRVQPFAGDFCLSNVRGQGATLSSLGCLVVPLPSRDSCFEPVSSDSCFSTVLSASKHLPTAALGECPPLQLAPDSQKISPPSSVTDTEMTHFLASTACRGGILWVLTESTLHQKSLQVLMFSL